MYEIQNQSDTSQIEGLEWKILATCHLLEKVSLADCWGKMSETTVQSLIQSCGTLTVLDLQNFDLGDLPIAVTNF